MDAVQELRLERGLLALVGEGLHRRDDPPDLLDVPPRARTHVDVGRPVQVAHRDDRGHRAAPVAQPLEDLEGLLETLGGLLHVGGDRQLAHHVLDRLPRRDPTHVRHVLARVDPVDEPPADPAELHHAELAEHRGEARVVAELAGQLGAAAVGLGGAVEVGLAMGRVVPLAERAREQDLPELETGGELDRRVAVGGGELSDLAGQRAGAFVLVLHPVGRRATQTQVALETLVAERFGQRGELGEALETVGGSPQHLERPVARLEQHDPLGRPGRGRERDVDDPQDLLGRVGVQRHARGLERELHAHLRVAGGLRVLREERQARRRGFAQQEEVDDRDVDRLPSRCREAGRRELADLVVREAVVGGRARLVFDQQAGGDGWRERGREVLGRHVLFVDAELDLAEVLQAEVAPEHGRHGERVLGVLGQTRRPARDQRSDGGGHEALGVARERPHAVDLLDHPLGPGRRAPSPRR